MHAIHCFNCRNCVDITQQTKPKENQFSRTHQSWNSLYVFQQNTLPHFNFLTFCVYFSFAFIFGFRSHLQIIILQLNESIRTGQWLILQSGAHTKTQIIKRINHLLDIKESNEFHQDFRLWIIVLETKAFPLEMLQRSFKGLFTMNLVHIMYTLYSAQWSNKISWIGIVPLSPSSLSFHFHERSWFS